MSIPNALRLAALLTVLAPSAALGQRPSSAVVGLSAGGTYYCIVSRCDTGTTLGLLAGYDVTRVLSVGATARWHACADCDRFLIGEGGVQLRYPGRVFAPFVAVGAGLSSDPEFMGDEFGLHAAVGTRFWATPGWGLQLELRGRQVGRGDHMGELSLGVTRRFGP